VNRQLRTDDFELGIGLDNFFEAFLRSMAGPEPTVPRTWTMLTSPFVSFIFDQPAACLAAFPVGAR
jgi:hypothetical protein